jgi:hypothetical protein
MSTSMWAYFKGQVDWEEFPDNDDEYKKLSNTQKHEILYLLLKLPEIRMMEWSLGK